MKAPEGFTPEQQKRFNDAIAAERRKQEAKFRQAQETLKKTEKQYQDLLASQSLTEQERKALQANLEMVQGQLRSKEEQLLLEKKQVEEVYAGGPPLPGGRVA